MTLDADTRAPDHPSATADVSPQVSLIITAHAEGPLAHGSVRSARRAVAFANRRGISVECIVVLDAPSEETRGYFFREEAVGAVTVVGFRDLGLSRNHGVSRARGKYIALLDADDLVSENWLHSAFRFSRAVGGEDFVLHPECSLYFGTSMRLWWHVASTAAEFSPMDLIEFNQWPALVFAPRSVMLRCPYREAPPKSGFGFEDWHWNCETLAEGIAHHMVPRTVHFLRNKAYGSLQQEHFSTNATVRPSRLFERPEGRARDAARGSARAYVRHVLKRVHRRVRPWGARALDGHTWLAGMERAVVDCVKRGSDALRAPRVPRWLTQEWRAMEEIEPALVVDEATRNHVPQHVVPHSLVGERYGELAAIYGSSGGTVFLLSHLRPGGTAREALACVERVTGAHRGTRAVCLLTEDTRSPWGEAPSGVTVVEFGRRHRNLLAHEQRCLLVRLLLQRAPEEIHVIRSGLGYDVLENHGPAIGASSRLFVWAFSSEMAEGDHLAGKAVGRLARCLDVVDGVLCDSPELADSLRRTRGFDSGKVMVNYQTVRNEEGSPPLDLAEPEPPQRGDHPQQPDIA